MSYIVKNGDLMLIVSFSTVSDNQFVVLATDSQKFYIEEIDGEKIMDRFNESDNYFRVTVNKIVRKLTEKPLSYELSAGNNNGEIRISVEYEIKANYVIKMYYKLKQCTSVEQVGKYFFSGLLKSLIEKSANDNFAMSAIKIQNPLDVSNLLNNVDNMSDICKMIGVETGEIPKENEQKKEETKEVEPRRPTKRVYEEKKFEYENTGSQEMELQEAVVAKQSTSKPSSKSKIPSRIKTKANVKF